MSIAVRTGLEPATPCVTGMYSNQAELPHQSIIVWLPSLSIAVAKVELFLKSAIGGMIFFECFFDDLPLCTHL